MAKVTSGEFTREFGRYRVMAHREPVVVTNHGRDDVVLISAEDYARLRRYEQKPLHVSQLPREVVDELGTLAPPEAASQFDHEYQP
jgi:prevent-host-death family protein